MRKCIDFNFTLQYVQSVGYNLCMDGSFNKEVKVKLDPSAIKKSIAHAQEMGTWPKKAEPSNRDVTPPFIPQEPLTRTHEQSMKVFHNIENEYQRKEAERKAKLQSPRTHGEAMEAFHRIEKEYRESQTQDQEQVVATPQVQEPSAPAITEKRSIFKRFFDRILGKS